jgi:hypothetical protein
MSFFNRDIVRQIMVQCSHQRPCIQCRVRPESYHLPLRVHTRVGSTGCYNPATLPAQPAYR